MKRKKKLPKYQLGNGSIDIKSPTTLWGWNQNANIDMLPPQNREGIIMSNQQNTPITEDLQQQTQMDKSYSFGFNPIAYAGLTGINQFLSGLGSRKEESKYKQSLIDNGNSAIPFANNFSSGVKYGYQKGGRAPKIYTDRKQFEQAQRMYNDSLDLYKLSGNVQRIYKNLPQISKEKYDALTKKEEDLIAWDIDKVEYLKDKKAGKIKPLEKYVYSRKNFDYNHPIYQKNNKKELDKYTNDVEKFSTVLPDGRIKTPAYVYNGKPIWDDYDIYDPKTKTSRLYSKDLDGKVKLMKINSDNIAPEKTLYYGSDKLVPVGAITSSGTGWYNGKQPSMKEKQRWQNYIVEDEAVDFYKKPVQPVVYQPQGSQTQPYKKTVSSIPQTTHPIQKMSRINPQQMDLNSNVNIQGQQIPFPQFQLPQQKGTPVYGPGNTIIGYSDNMNFKPAYEYTGASNNQLNLQDKALLADPEALKKYVLSRDNYKFPTEEFQQGGFSDPGHEEIINNGYPASIPTNRYVTENPNDPTYNRLNQDWQSGLQRTYNPLSQRSFDDKSKFMEENKPKFINDLRNRISNEDINSDSGFEIHNDVLTQAGYQGRRAWNINDITRYSDDLNRINENPNFYNPYLKYNLRNDLYKDDELLYKDNDTDKFTGITQSQLDLPIPMLRQDKPKLGMNSMSTIPLGLNNEQSIITGIPTSMKPGNASLDFRERSNSQMNSMSTTPSILESFKARMKGLPTNMTSGNATLNLTDETPSPARQSMESMTTGNYPFNKDNNVSFNPQAQSYPNIKNSMTAINPTNYKPSSQQANITGTPVIPNTKPININLSETEDPIVRDNKTMSSINPSPYPFTKSGPSQMTGNMQEYPKQKMGMTAMSSAPYSSNNPANIKGVQTNMQIPTVQQPSYTTHPIEVYDKRGKFLRKEFIGNDKGIVDHKYIGRHHYAPRGGNSYIDTSYKIGGSFQDYLRQQNKPITENPSTLYQQPTIDEVKKQQALAKQAALYDRSFSKTPLETPASKARSIQLKNNYVANNPYSKLNDKGEIEAVSPERDLQGTPYNYTQAWRNDDGFQNMMHGVDAAMIATGVGELGVTVAKNAYKLNPHAIKNWYDVFHKGTLKNMLPGENAVNITRGLESENAIKDLFNTGIVRNNKSAGNVLTKRSSNYGERVFWADSESPLVGNNNFQITAKNSKELKNRPVTKDDIISIKRKTDNGYEDYPNWQNSFNTTPKPHWLKGYREVPKQVNKPKVIDFIGKEEVAPHTNGAYGYPKQVSGAGMDVYPNTPNKFLNQEYSSFGNMEKGVVNKVDDFKSEIDWGKWNKEIPDNHQLIKEYNAIDYRKNPLSDKEKEMYQWFDEQMRFDKLPETTNKQSIEVLDNFKQRIKTPEGQKRLKELGITEEQLLQDLKIVEDPNTYGYYRGLNKNTIAINPNHPLPKKVVRHEIEHGVQNALRKSKINKAIDGTPAEKLKALEINTTEIDDILSELTLRREGTPNKVWNKINTNETVNINDYKSLINNKQNATDYFLTGSDGAEKSAFLGEVQQYMMDAGKIPKNSYVQITPEMVKETMVDAMFDEKTGGKYLRLFNIIKADPKNYEIISKGLNKMLSITPLIGAGAYMQNKEYKNGGAIGNNGMFDMTNPNIYKAAIPGLIGAGVLGQKKLGGLPGKANIYQKGGAFDYGFLLEDDEDENQYNKNEAENNDRVTEEDVQEEVAKQSRKLADMEFLFGSNKVRKDRDVNRFDDDYVAPDSSSDGTDWASKFKSVEDPNSKFDHGNGAYGSFGFRKTGHLAEAYKSPEFQEVREQFGDYNSFWNSFKQSGYGPLSKTVDSRYEDWLKRQTGNNISIAGKFNLTGSKSPSSNWMVGNNMSWQGYVNKLNKYKAGGTYSVDNGEIANLIQKGVKFKFV